MKNQFLFTYLLFIALSFTFFSCSKENTADAITGEGNARVQISIASTTTKSASTKKSASASLQNNQSSISLSDIKQEQILDIGGGYQLQATLIDETLLQQQTEKLANTPIDRNKVLDADVAYRVIVYATNGDYVTHKDYAYGQESQAGDLMLIGGTGGTEYTFVVYSINTTTALPDIPNMATTKLQNTSLTVDAVQSDLMYFKKTMRVSTGENKLSIELAHLFSQITTTIFLTNDTQGYIKKIENPTIKPSASTATINLGVGESSLSYGTPSPTGAPVSFPAIRDTTTRTITSAPTYVAANAPQSGTFDIAELIIAAVVTGAPSPEPKDVIKAVSIPDVNIIPGHRYKLLLEYKVPCLQVMTTVNSQFAWYSPSGTGAIRQSNIIMPPADFGFMFDIYYLDNSFNMTINGVRLTLENRDIQFQSGVSGNPVNVSFLNNDKHGTNSAYIYDIKNFTPATSTDPANWVAVVDKPALRMVIDADGSVSLWGARRVHTNGTNTALEKLKVISPLTNGITFQKVIWNKTSDNNITVSQLETGPTAMFGIGRGLQIIKCP